MFKKIILILALIGVIVLIAYGALSGTYTTNGYFYLPGYGEYGIEAFNEYNAYMQIADTQIEANKNPFSNIVQCSDYANPDDAITAISTDNKTLLVTEVETCDTNFTVPANVTVKFERGGKWTINTGITVTFNGQIDAGLWQIFAYTGTGVVTLGSIKEVYPEWWGADNTGTADSNSSFTSIISSFTTKGNIFIGKQSIFRLDTTVATASKEISIYGGGTIKLGADVSAFSVDGGILEIRDMNFTTVTSGTGNVAIALNTSTGKFVNNIVTNLFGGMTNEWSNSLFEKNDIFLLPATSEGGYGIHFAGSNNRVIGNYFTGGKHHVYLSGATGIPTDYNIVSNNVCKNAGAGAISIYALAAQDGIHFNEINGNTIIDDNGIPIQLTGNVKNNKIVNNLIKGFLGCSGIYIEGAVDNQTEDNIIEGNTIINNVANDTTHDNIRITISLRTIVSGNTLIRPTTDTSTATLGINIISTASTQWTQVVNNTFVFCALFNGADTENTQISGNSFYVYTGTTPVQNSSATAYIGINNSTLGITSAVLAGIISDETGTDKLVYNTSPTLVTPTLGAASATSINLTGGQIAFPATQAPSADANTLDDYEEGTWTMGVSFGGGTTGITYSYNTGYYTRIGNIVIISGLCVLTSKGTSTGDAVITGLPSTVVNNAAGYAPVTLSFCNITFANQFEGEAVINTTVIYLYEITEAGVRTTLTNADFADNSSFLVNCTYRVN